MQSEKITDKLIKMTDKLILEADDTDALENFEKMVKGKTKYLSFYAKQYVVGWNHTMIYKLAVSTDAYIYICFRIYEALELYGEHIDVTRFETAPTRVQACNTCGIKEDMNQEVLEKCTGIKAATEDL